MCRAVSRMICPASSGGISKNSQASRRRKRSCFRNCPKPRQARSRNSNCGPSRKACEGPRGRRHAGRRCNARSGHFMVAQSSNRSSCRTLAKSPPSPPRPKPRARRHAGWRYNGCSGQFIPPSHRTPVRAAPSQNRRPGGRVGDRAAVLRTLIPRGGALNGSTTL